MVECEMVVRYIATWYTMLSVSWSIEMPLSGAGRDGPVAHKVHLLIQTSWTNTCTCVCCGPAVSYGMISKIESFSIEGQEEYCILSLQIGSSSSTRYWLYYVPSQYVAAIKLRILGVMSLL